MNIFEIRARIRWAKEDGAYRAVGFPLPAAADDARVYTFRLLDRKDQVRFEATLKPSEYDQATRYWLALQAPLGAQHKGITANDDLPTDGTTNGAAAGTGG